MLNRKLLPALGAAGVALCAVGVALAQVRIEVPRVEIPDRRPNPHTGVDMGDLVGGLFALKDGYDRSRRGYVCVLNYEDRNGNGRRDRGEAPMPGWSFSIANAAGATMAQGVTDRDGRFCNERPMEPGPYTVNGVAAEGWTNTEPGEPPPHAKPVTLPRDRSVTVLFGNHKQEARPVSTPSTPQSGLGEICVEKYAELNNNGQRDPSEPGLSGWTFGIATGWGAPFLTIVTDATGRACTGQTLPAPASYVVDEAGQPGWTRLTPIGWSNVSPGGTTIVRFANRPDYPQAAICVTKYNDLNGNGQRDGGEPAVPNVPFDILDASGIVKASGATAAAGMWCSPPIFLGAFSVREQPMAGWTITDPAGPSRTKPVSVTGQTAQVVFGNRQDPSEICVEKFEDVNSNGVRDPGEPPQGGITFLVTNGQTFASGGTNGQGVFCSGLWLPPGNYTVIETVPPGWAISTPAGNNQTAVAAAGQTTTVVVGNRAVPPPPPLGQVCVEKFNDLDGDGVRDPGEPPHGGPAFYITNGSFYASGSTSSAGTFCSGPMQAGTYTVTETIPPGWSLTTPAGNGQAVTVVDGQTTTVVIGNRENPSALPGEICVEKYNDLNGNGVKDPGEPGLAGWSFTVRDASGAVVGQGVTGANGRWCMPAMAPPGAYTVGETMQTGWTSTDPGGAAPSKAVTVGSNQTVIVPFGNQASVTPPSLTIVKTKLSAGICHGSQPGANNCTFRFTVTNTGGTAYSGPLSISDTVTMGGPLQVSVVTPPPGWACTPGVASPIVCAVGSVTIQPGGTVTYDLELFLNAPAPSQKNCAVLTWGGGQQTGPACVQIFP